MKTPFKITTSAYNAILKTVASQPAEQGGVLIGTKEGVITDFIHDEDAVTTAVTYTINTQFLNPKIKAFTNEGKEFLGILHSHPGLPRLSHADKQYFQSQFENFDRPYFYTPIVFSAKDDTYDFFPFIFYKDGTVVTGKLEVLPDNYNIYTNKNPANKKDENRGLNPFFIFHTLVTGKNNQNHMKNQLYITYQQAFYLMIMLGVFTSLAFGSMLYYYFKLLHLIIIS